VRHDVPWLLGFAILLAGSPAMGEAQFHLELGPAGITSLKRPRCPFGTEFIAPGRALGEVALRYREAGGPWREAVQGKPAEQRSGPTERVATWHSDTGADGPLRLIQRFRVEGDALVWTLRIENGAKRPLEIGDLALPLPMHTLYPRITGDAVKKEIFTRRLFRHAFISGHGSFVFWLPVGGVGPHLVMTPLEHTKLEYFAESRSDYAHGGHGYTVFIHSAASGGGERRGTWRQKHTSLTLAPGQEATYGFAFRWADDYQGVRDILYRSGGFDLHVVPGMVLPQDLAAMFALRTRNRIERVAAEFPEQTRIERLRAKAEDVHVYRVRFARLGENLLTVRCAGGRETHLEFFVTQPLETVIRKRAAFIARKQQHRNPAKWYDGLFSLWDVRLPEGQNLLGPDNLGGQHPYAVSGSDDPSNSKCIYLAEKNVAYPEAAEIEALEYFLRNFVWGKHQRTDQERPYPFGIYGSDSWHQNRFANRDPLAKGVSRPGGPSQCRMWRSFDYTTYFALYYNMYRIAKQHPSLCPYLDAAGYLQRAYGTARAFFEVPYNIRMEGGWAFTGWTDWAYTIGNFHEKYLLGIIEALEREGQQQKADALRGEWEKKVKYFLYDDPLPFVSEMPVDSTAYESTYAIARYALTHGLKPDEKLWRDKNTGTWYSHPKIDPKVHQEFLQRQLLANLACRGWLETSYGHLGSDFRGCGGSFYCLSYMSQMGGWAILDHALRFERDPAPLARLGYAAMLSSWALVNAGTPETNYGFWHPGERHDGAVGWGFMPQKFGIDWNPATKGIPRGAWPVDGEIDHGLTAYVETAATVVLDDPLFGLIALGGESVAREDAIQVVPRDGVRQRLAVVLGDVRVRLNLDRDGFAKGRPIRLARDLGEIAFTLESRDPGMHQTTLTLEGLPSGTYEARSAGEVLATIEGGTRHTVALSIPVPAAGRTTRVAIRRKGNR